MNNLCGKKWPARHSKLSTRAKMASSKFYIYGQSKDSYFVLCKSRSLPVMAPMLNPHFKNTLIFGSVSPLWECTCHQSFQDTTIIVATIQVLIEQPSSPMSTTRQNLPWVRRSSLPSLQVAEALMRHPFLKKQQQQLLGLGACKQRLVETLW